MPMKFEGCYKLLFEFSKNGVGVRVGKWGEEGGEEISKMTMIKLRCDFWCS